MEIPELFEPDIDNVKYYMVTHCPKCDGEFTSVKVCGYPEWLASSGWGEKDAQAESWKRSSPDDEVNKLFPGSYERSFKRSQGIVYQQCEPCGVKFESHAMPDGHWITGRGRLDGQEVGAV